MGTHLLWRRLMRKLSRGAVLALLLTGAMIALAGCGGSSSTPLQEAEVEYKKRGMKSKRSKRGRKGSATKP
jgi:hypothetical protein